MLGWAWQFEVSGNGDSVDGGFFFLHLMYGFNYISNQLENKIFFETCFQSKFSRKFHLLKCR